jgi:hypothetical protein
MKKLIFLFPAIILIMIFQFIGSETKSSGKPGFNIHISTNKNTYVEGEYVDIRYEITNNKPNLDSLLDLNEGTFLEKTEIKDERNVIKKYEKGEGYPYTPRYTKFKQGETKIFEFKDINSGKGFEGCFFSYFPSGKYTIKTVLFELSGLPIISNSITFSVQKPEGEEYFAFEEVKSFEDFYLSSNKTIDSIPNFIDRSISFLYKYPKSMYTPRVIINFDFNRNMFDYKYDDSYISDIEFFISNNPSEPSIYGLLNSIVDIKLRKDKVSKSEAISFLQKMKTKFNNDILNNYIDQVILENKKLK